MKEGSNMSVAPCETCKRNRHRTEASGKFGWYCHFCGTFSPDGKAPVYCGRGAEEADIVAAAVQLLEISGYVVLRVGQHRADKAGQTPGTPDLFVGREGAPFWLGLEMKTGTGRVRKEQKELAEKGLILVARTPEEALRLAEDWFRKGLE